MDGDYEDHDAGTLTSPVYDFTGSGATALFLSFHYWCETEGGFDGARVEVFDGQDFNLRVPLEGYSDLTLGGIGFQGGWSGNSGGWQGTVFDLSEFAASALQFRLVFGADAGITGAGFWIDDVTLDTGSILTGVTDPAAPPPTLDLALAAFPNPFNPTVTIAWKIDRPGPVAVEIFDLRGRRIRSLLEEAVDITAGTVTWNGADLTGRTAASGVYVVRLRGPDGATVTRQVVLAK